MIMRPKSIVAILLIAFGFLVLAYAGITFTTPGETIRFLNWRIATTETHFIPPLAGVLAITAGLGLLLVKGRRPV